MCFIFASKNKSQAGKLKCNALIRKIIKSSQEFTLSLKRLGPRLPKKGESMKFYSCMLICQTAAPTTGGYNHSGIAHGHYSWGKSMSHTHTQRRERDSLYVTFSLTLSQVCHLQHLHDDLIKLLIEAKAEKDWEFSTVCIHIITAHMLTKELTKNRKTGCKDGLSKLLTSYTATNWFAPQKPWQTVK